MAIEAIELYESRSAVATDAAGRSTATRVFRIPGVRQAVLAQEIFYSTAGTITYPDHPGLVLDRIEARPSATGSETRIVAYYSTFNAGRFQVPQQLESNPPPEYGWDKRDVDIEIPVNVREAIAVKGEADTTIEVWAVQRFRVSEVRVLRRVKVRYYTNNVNDFDPIAVQINRLHTINGAVYRFVDGNPVRNNAFADGYDITYTWELDKGTNFPNAPQQGDRWLLLRPGNVSIPLTQIRPPYSRLTVVPSLEPEVEPNEIIAVFPYTSDANGWQTLPGVVT